MSTDTTLSAIDIIRIYGLLFKIEHTFKQAVRLIGTFSYHFWLRDMKPRKHRDGDQYLHRLSKSYRDGVERNSRVASFTPLFARLGLPLMVLHPALGEPIKFV